MVAVAINQECCELWQRRFTKVFLFFFGENRTLSMVYSRYVDLV